MSYCFIACNCIACDALITINPTYCPSLTVNGKKEPICRVCFKNWNEIHRPNNPLQLHPEAYQPLPYKDLGKACTDPKYMGKSETKPVYVGVSDNLTYATADQKEPVDHPHNGDIDFEIQIYLDLMETTMVVRGHLEHYLRQLGFSSDLIEESIDNQAEVGFITIKGGV